MSESILFHPFDLHGLTLRNRIVMAPDAPVSVWYAPQGECGYTDFPGYCDDVSDGGPTIR